MGISAIVAEAMGKTILFMKTTDVPPFPDPSCWNTRCPEAMLGGVGRHVASSNAGQVAEALWPDCSDTVDDIDGLVPL